MFVKCNYYTVKISYSCFYSIWGTSSSSKTNTYENLISPSQDSMWATVHGAVQENPYNGSTSSPFKTRYSKHLTINRHERYENETELLKLIWRLKRKEINYTLSRGITSRAQPYKCGSRRCDLCLAEKVVIARCRHPGMIEKRTELLAKCRHRNEYLLSEIKH